MEKKRLEDLLTQLSMPGPEHPPFETNLKWAILNSERSSRIGLLFIGFPALIFVLAIFQSFVHANLISLLFGHLKFAAPPAWRGLIFFILMVGFPILSLTVNMLSISVFRYNRNRKELFFTIKVRWWNIILTIVSGLLASFFLIYLMTGAINGK